MRWELRLNRLGFCRFEYATHNQLPLAVDEGVGHFLLAREPVGGLQWLDPKSTGTCPQWPRLSASPLLLWNGCVAKWSYLTRCLTNFSWLLTAGVFLWITGTCAWIQRGNAECETSALGKNKDCMEKTKYFADVHPTQSLTFWSPRYFIMSFSQ